MKTYRIYFSGQMSSRHSNNILHQMLPTLGFSAENGTGSDQIPAIRNMHRGNEESYFDVDIPSNDTDAESIIDSIRRYVLDSSVQYEDITTEQPKAYKINA